ncbi:5-(carboxyamino)imidazole ribonucleotide synthase [Bacillus piscicola]|uniref:5-(carboxyamino)imidazole ribonucleotide synthase n=1 Tax=Bacillus piscicola TaxID=1632684 RepID=UPI001F0A009E|nr:5-(carboxyamino)imidazole ribonucleotide synthase [Bacillus piscicola]
MKAMLPPGKTIGILGGGQLGRMMALAAKAMGFRIAVMEPKSDSPTGQVADEEVVATYDDRDGALQLAETCDVLTYEFENIDADTASFLEEKLYLPQGSKLLFTTQHRLREKQAIEGADVPVAPYRGVKTETDLTNALQELKCPAVLKTCQGGYDGKGQVVIKNEHEASEAFSVLGGGDRELVLESWIPFEKEISVIVTRSTTGEITTFPVGENVHQHNILHQTIVPARISSQTKDKAERIARRLAEKLELIGTLAVEMFVINEGTIYVNELAPRPHNSGHYTIEACETSQFAQHIRAVCGWPLGETALLKPVVMTNILGQHLSPVYENLKDLAKQGHVHLYGKEEAKHGRKMGHWTVLGESVEDALDRTENIWKTVSNAEQDN